MNLPTRGEGPPTGLLIDLDDLLIDLGDSLQSSGAGQNGVFDAEEAIAEVFGSFREPIAGVPFSSPHGVTPVTQPPSEPSAHTYSRGGIQESKKQTNAPKARQGEGGFGRAPPSGGFGSTIGAGFGSAAARTRTGIQSDDRDAFELTTERGFGGGNNCKGFGNQPTGFIYGGGFGDQTAWDRFERKADTRLITNAAVEGSQSVSSLMPPSFEPGRRGFGDGFGGKITDALSNNRFDRPPMGSLGGFGRAPPSGGFGSKIGGGFGSAAARTRTGIQSDDRDAFDITTGRGFGGGNNCKGFGNQPTGFIYGGEFGDQTAWDRFERKADTRPIINAAVGVPKAKDDPFLSRGFGRSNEDLARLHGSPRSGRSTGRGSGKRSKCSGRRGRSSHALFLPTDDPSDGPVLSSSPVTLFKEDPFEGSSKRPPKFGDRKHLHDASKKRQRVSCGHCGRPGHETEVCRIKLKGTLRCYNCNQLGHLSARCTHRPSRRCPQPPANGTKQVQDSGNVSQSVDLVSTLMLNPELRSDMERANEVVHDSTLDYMLKHVKL